MQIQIRDFLFDDIKLIQEACVHQEKRKKFGNNNWGFHTSHIYLFISSLHGIVIPFQMHTHEYEKHNT